MTKDNALRLALEVLEDLPGFRADIDNAINAINETLAQPEQEPAVFARRWKLAVDGFGLQRDDDNGNYVDIDDALSVLHHFASMQSDLTEQDRKSYQKGHNDGVAHHKQAVKAAQPEQKQTGIREIRVTETVKPERKPFTYYDPVRDAIRPFKADGDIPLYTIPLAQPEQEPMVCCGDYATCMKSCTPRGRWLAEQEPVADRLVRQYINSLVANKPDEAANATKAMVDYVYTSPPAQPEQEPVAWMCNAFDGEACEQSNHDECENPIPLYTTPPKELNK